MSTAEQDRKDAECYRALQAELGELLGDDGTGSNVSAQCAMYLAARTHRINAEKAKFRMDGITLEDGTPIGNWEVSIKKVG